MDLSALLPVIDGAVGLDRLRSRMSTTRSLLLGVSDGAMAAVLAALSRDVAVPLLIVVPRPQHAKALVDELRAWLGGADADRVLLYPERDALPYERLQPDPDDICSRLVAADALERNRVLREVAQNARVGDAEARVVGAGGSIIVGCGAAFAQRTIAPEELRDSTTAVARGERTAQHDLLLALDRGGYRFEPEVTAPGEASRRGGIIDVWPPSEDMPLRIELFGDGVESIRTFNPGTQRSSELREAVRI